MLHFSKMAVSVALVFHKHILFRNKLKSHENFIFWLKLALNTRSAHVITRREDILFYRKEIEIKKKTLFGHQFDQKQSVAFSLLFSIFSKKKKLSCRMYLLTFLKT